MVERSLRPDGPEALLVLTRVHLVATRVVGLLLPPVTVHTVLHVLTALRILSDVPPRDPILALGVLVLKQLRISPEILPVVCIHTICLMVILAERTPLRLEMIHIKFKVARQLVN